MSFWKKLFGGGGGESAPKQSEPEDYKGYVLRAAPFDAEGQFQTAGSISKEIGGETKTHEFIRADRHASYEEAVSFALMKARQIVDEQGDRVFR
jgi:hypothetical protein